MRSGSSAPIGWVLYDGTCGLCSRLVRTWGGTLRARGFEPVPLQRAWVRARLNTTDEDLVRDLRLLFTDGRQLRGADAYRHLLRRIWWAYPLYVLSRLPLGRTLFDRAYRTFADHRHEFSSSCALPEPGHEGHEEEATKDAKATKVDGKTATKHAKGESENR